MDMGTIMKIASALLGIPPARLPIYDQASLNSTGEDNLIPRLHLPIMIKMQ